MSTRNEILDVHKSETKFKLKPHLASMDETIQFIHETKGPLRVTLAELFTPETITRLKELKLL